MLKKYVTFYIDEEVYAIDIMQVKTVHKLEKLYKLPNMPDSIKGVFKLRNNIVPIVDLKKQFNFEGKETKSDNVIVIVVDGMEIGIMIDKVKQVNEIDEDSIQPPPVLNTGINKEYLTGVSRMNENELVILININKLFSHSELSKLKDIKVK